MSSRRLSSLSLLSSQWRPQAALGIGSALGIAATPHHPPRRLTARERDDPSPGHYNVDGRLFANGLR